MINCLSHLLQLIISDNALPDIHVSDNKWDPSKCFTSLMKSGYNFVTITPIETDTNFTTPDILNSNSFKSTKRNFNQINLNILPYDDEIPGTAILEGWFHTVKSTKCKLFCVTIFLLF
jgi:hypothetical protein